MRILVIDGHPFVGVALSNYLEQHGSKISEVPVESRAVFTLKDGIAAVSSGNPPNLVILDPNLRDSRGTETLRRFQAGNIHNVPVAIFTDIDSNDVAAQDTIRQYLDSKVAGILLKSADLEATFRGLARIIQGDLFLSQELNVLALARANVEQSAGLTLTPREWTVANAIVRGRQNKMIASDLGLTESAVRHVASNIYRKLGVRNRMAAVIFLSNKEPQSNYQASRLSIRRNPVDAPVDARGPISSFLFL
jgi:two-component system, NarL family, response regulator YdfI